VSTILVTGGLGFIGSHFIELALKKGYRVINYDKVTYASNINFSPESENYSFTKVDIKDLKTLPRCEHIVHFAAESSVDCSIEDSAIFIESNILATYNLLELIRKEKNKPTLTYIGTDEVFGDIIDGSFKETTYRNPSNPYASTKACAEMLIGAWGRTFDIPYRITRTTNNYGTRQHYEKLIPNCINRFLNDEKILIHGTGEYIRNWIHVKDNCDAILQVMERGTDGELYNISSDEEYDVLQIIDIVLSQFGEEISSDTTDFVPNRPGQDIRYALDSSKIKKELGWEQERKLKTEIAKIIKFYEGARFENSTIL